MVDEYPKTPGGSEVLELVLRASRKHALLAFVTGLAVFAAVAFYTVGEKRIYRAVATIQIEPNPPQPLGKEVQAIVDVGNGSYWDNKEYYRTQLEILGGRALAQETARTLGLQSDLAFLANVPPGKPLPPKARAVTVEEAAAAIQGRLGVALIKDTRLVRATFDDTSPDRARRILAALLDVYMERNISQVVSSSASASDWLRGQTDKLKQELESSELALHDYKKDKRILSVSLDDQSNMLRGEMVQLSAALTTVNAKRESLAARVTELDKVALTDPMTLPASDLLASPILTSLRGDYVAAKASLDSLLSAGKGENHPETEALRAKVEATHRALLGEVANVQGGVRSELSAATQEAHGLSRLFEQAKQRALDLNMLEIEYRRLERSKINTEKLFGLVLERSKESDLTGMLRFNNITVAEPPASSGGPIKPKVPANLAIGALLGIILGVGLALGREWFDRTIRVPKDAEDATGKPLLGTLPEVSGKVSSVTYYARAVHKQRQKRDSVKEIAGPVELVVHALPASNAAECARGIRTSLSFASPDKPYKTLLVTSATPSEGKTTVATAIAITFAQAGQRVLLVDCDLRRARLHRVFQTTNASGVASVLQDPETLDAAIVTTEVPGLHLLSAGPYVPNPAEVLQSASFERMLKQLSGMFDRVIIDSPPVMVVTDAVVLASRVDATVLVCRARKTKRDVARIVVNKLTGIGAKVGGVVLNAMEEPKSKGGYYYGYYSRDHAQDESSSNANG